MTPTPKYELTDETREVAGRTLRRIRARSSFCDVAAGDLGGWVETEENLSQAGAAWVSGDAQVSGDAWVYGDAHLLCIGPIGSRHAILTVTRDKGLGLRFTTGCFSGSGAEFAAAVAETHEEGSTARIEYDAAIAMVDAWTRANGHDQAPPEPTPAEPAEVQA